jgi:hypothetical protein
VTTEVGKTTIILGDGRTVQADNVIIVMTHKDKKGAAVLHSGHFSPQLMVMMIEKFVESTAAVMAAMTESDHEKGKQLLKHFLAMRGSTVDGVVFEQAPKKE